MGDCALITPVYLEIALFSGARSGTQVTGQVISAIDIADISIHALREEGDRCGNTGRGLGFVISTHALREEGDKAALLLVIYVKNFYPRPPRGGRREDKITPDGESAFLSTPSVRRVTDRFY